MKLNRRQLIAAAGAAAAVGAPAGAAQQAAGTTGSRVPVVDIHTHMYTRRWLDALKASGDADTVVVPGNPESISYRGVNYAVLAANMFDWQERIARMDEAGVDIAVISLTAPNVYWGTVKQGAEAARIVNDEYAEAQARWPGRIRWFASLPWEDADLAITELHRAIEAGAVGVCMLTNIKGQALVDPKFAPVWAEIDRIDVPVFIHPTTPFVDGFGLGEYGMANTIGFTTDTTTCFAKFLLSGFFEKYPRVRPIASHGGGTLPFLAGRFDRMWEISTARRDIGRPPSSYLRRIYFDSIVYDQRTLEYLVATVGADRVLFGSDYPFRLGDMKGILGRVNALPPEERDAVRGLNAIRELKLQPA
ncbi:MAG: amidohydrolase family protein [Pseudomonadota bacterium]|jgi:aminocarboxymuconate-semialdehyde decarboxylase|nr:MAG: 2-amino-3-carboxymuconate-6-semialdehyde decarboxylase [Pseudomonadota bacterium]